MAFYLYLTLGPLDGKRIRLRHKLTLGRTGAHINLQDPKVSNIHAQVLKDEEGNWSVRDIGSRNGVYYEGNRCKRIVLKEGMSIFIGDHKLTLQWVDKKEQASKKNALKPWKWKENLLNFCHDITSQVQNTERHILPFTPLYT